MTKLSETYIHLKMDATDVFREEVAVYLKELAQDASFKMFNQETLIDIRFEEGSWKTWIAVAGAIYISVGQYGSFRSGIEYLVKDARRFSNIVIERFVDKEKLSQDIIYRTEKRLGIPGKIHRLFQRIDRLQENFPSDGSRYPWGDSFSKLKKASIDKEFLKIKYEILEIYDLLDHEQDQSLFIRSLGAKIHDYNIDPPKITIKVFPEIRTGYSLKKYISGIPVSDRAKLPSSELKYPRNEGMIKEEDEMEKLKKIIKSKRFDIGVGD
jgi:hypothetical protein